MIRQGLNTALIWAQRIRLCCAYTRKTKRLYGVNPALKVHPAARDRKSARAYWSQFGFAIDPEWHGIYAAASGRHDDRMVPENVYYALLEPALNSLEQAPAYADKNAYEQLFPDVPMPLTLCRRVDGQFYAADYTWLSEADAVERLVEAAPADFIIKPSVHSGGGLNVMCFSRLAEASPETPLGELVRRALDQSPGDLIVQACVRQHDSLAALHPESLNTLKIMSMRSGRVVRVKPATGRGEWRLYRQRRRGGPVLRHW